MRRPTLAMTRALACGLGLVLTSSAAHADAIDEISKALTRDESEAKTLAAGVQKPRKSRPGGDAQTRKLIDAQVAYSTGDFDNAAVMLYDFVAQYPEHHDIDQALYYLAESLFQKSDFIASRTYFTQLVKDVGSKSKFYQQGLERLIELSLALRDGEGVEDWLAALDRIPGDERRPSVPYVQGKYAYFQDRYADALALFGKVPKGSEYYFQAQYFIGTIHVAEKDLGGATKTFAALTKLTPKADADKDRRVIELAQLALGRLHYERDQPSKAIDRYLMVDRKSDLFDEALFEIAWVYVKNKQFDKALRALELLALADPTSSKMPTVRILEGNLRIRKAQMLVEGGKGDPAEEYGKADDIFAKTHSYYVEPHDELQRIIEANADPQQFMTQVTGRTSKTFDTNATLPEIAASWIREEPDMQRVVSIETDLGDIDDNISEAERTIERLDQALASPSRVNIYPSLADKRTRATEIVEEIFSLRQQLATHERALVRRHASASEMAHLEQLQAARQAVAKKLAELPDAEVSYGERIDRARKAFDDIDQRASKTQIEMDAAQATLVALERYIIDNGVKGTPEQLAELQRQIDETKGEIEEMRLELASIRREAILGKDEAGTGDETADRAKLLRSQMRAALDDEHRAMMAVMESMSGDDKEKAARITRLTDIANSTQKTLDRMLANIDTIVEQALDDVRADLDREKAALGAYKREFLTYEAESRGLGGAVLSQSFLDVKAKFLDVLVRTDVGVVDVSWSEKEDVDETAQRLNLDKQREVKTLREEFRDLLIEDKAPAGGGK